MIRKLSLVLILVLSLTINLIPIRGQNPETPGAATEPTQASQDDDDVVRITTNLVQVDAVVVDKNGKQVTDLTADDFKIEENGDEQKITNFSYVPIAPLTDTQPIAAVTPKNDQTQVPTVPPVPLKPEQIRRTIALVVDDLGLSRPSVPYVRRALAKFVDEQMQNGDLVAVMLTSESRGVALQLTTDKKRIHTSINRVRWNPLGRGGSSTFAPIEGDDIADEARGDAPTASAESNNDINELSNEVFTIGTLGTLNYIIQGLRDVPGRKSVMLFSDGLTIRDSEGRSNRIRDTLRRLADYANRSSVVIYTMDARGLPSLELNAEDNVRGMQRPTEMGGGSGRGGRGGKGSGPLTNRIDSSLLGRRLAVFESQQGLNFLAEQTGGLAIRNSNDLSGGIKKMMDDQQGYYLIGYQPDANTFDPKRMRFNKLTIKVKRSGLKVRYRTGFMAYTDDEAKPAAPVTRAQQLALAISKPFASDAIDVRLTSLFANDAVSGSFMRSLLHVDAGKLTFVEEPDDWHTFVFDVMAVTFAEGGEVIDEVSRTENVRVRGDTYWSIVRNGFDYILTVPIKKPGAYQLRAALRDAATQRVGTASQFIEVPDLTKNRIALSGIIINGYDPLKLAKSAEAGSTSTVKVKPEPQTGPGVRRLFRGFVLEFGLIIYNAQLDKVTQRPQLQTQIRLFRDGREVYAGSVLPFDPGSQIDMSRLNAGGRLQLGTDMQPGEYILQVIVTDLLNKEKQRFASQWIDFQISDK